jgi:PAS domain S-box-containing protein
VKKSRLKLTWFCYRHGWGFLLFICILWLLELFDLPAYIFNTAHTPFNWKEALIETIFILAIAIFYLTALYRSQKSSIDSFILHQESEDKYRQVVERANDGILIIQDEKIVYCNPSTEEISGFSKNEIIGKSFMKFAGEQDKEKIYESYRRRMQGEKIVPYEAIFKHKQNRIFYAEISGGLITLNKKPANLVIIRDITTRKKKQIQLQKERQYYISFVESLYDWVWEIDKHGYHTFSNSAVKDILGYSKDEVIGKNMMDFWPRKPEPEEKAKTKSMLNSGKMWNNQKTYFRHKNGKIKILESSAIPIFNESNKLIGYRGVDRDITQRARTEKRVTEINNVFQNFGTYPDDNMQFITNKTNQILEGSFSIYKRKTSSNKLEIAFENNLPSSWIKTKNIEDDICYQVILPDKMEAIIIPNLDDLDVNDQNIKTHHVKSLLAFPVHLHNKIIGALCLYCQQPRQFTNDDLQTISTFGKAISLEEERKNIITKLQETNLELVELKKSLQNKVKKSVVEIREKEQLLLAQSRRAAMGEMIGNIAHQWRQPLSAVAAIVQDLEDAYDYNELDKEYLENSIEKSMEQLEYMSRTIDDFRNFFKPNNCKKEFSIKESMEKGVGFLEKSFFNNGIKLELNIDDDCIFSGFPNQFSQVILNILNNAKDALLENLKTDRNLSIDCYKKNDKIHIEISDNAGGINPEYINKIFDPYFSTKEQGKGTGVGLYMAKVIIEKHMNGSISATNTAEGAKFIITL